MVFPYFNSVRTHSHRGIDYTQYSPIPIHVHTHTNYDRQENSAS